MKNNINLKKPSVPMEKRGTLMFKALATALLFGAIITIFVLVGRAYGNLESYYKLGAARDIALAIDTAYSIDHDFTFYYPVDLTKFRVEVKDGIVRVSSIESYPDFSAGKHPFTRYNTDNPDYTIAGKKYIVIAKQDGRIIISEYKDTRGFGGGDSGGAVASGVY
jgi:hypothetical protein